MSEDRFGAEQRVQNDYLRTQLAALRTGPRSRWKRFRLLEAVCGGCGDVLAEVMHTDPYRVVCTRGVTKRNEPTTPRPPEAATSKEKASAYRRRSVEAGTAVRLGEHKFIPIPEHWTPGPDHTLFVACRWRQGSIPQSLIAEPLGSGRKRVTIPRD